MKKARLTDAPFRLCSLSLGVAPGPLPSPAPSYYSYKLRKGGGILREIKSPAVAIKCLIGCGSATNQDGTKPSYILFPLLPAYYHTEAPEQEAFNKRRALRSSYLSEHCAPVAPSDGSFQSERRNVQRLYLVLSDGSFQKERRTSQCFHTRPPSRKNAV